MQLASNQILLTAQHILHMQKVTGLLSICHSFSPFFHLSDAFLSVFCCLNEALYAYIHNEPSFDTLALLNPMLFHRSVWSDPAACCSRQYHSPNQPQRSKMLKGHNLFIFKARTLKIIYYHNSVIIEARTLKL